MCVSSDETTTRTRTRTRSLSLSYPLDSPLSSSLSPAAAPPPRRPAATLLRYHALSASPPLRRPFPSPPPLPTGKLSRGRSTLPRLPTPPATHDTVSGEARLRRELPVGHRLDGASASPPRRAPSTSSRRRTRSPAAPSSRSGRWRATSASPTPTTTSGRLQKELAARSSRWARVWPSALRWIPTSTDRIIAAEKRLLSILKHMEQLMKANQGTLCNEVKSEALKTYTSRKPYQEKYACLEKANGNLEKKVLSLEEKYESAAQANGKLEEEVLLLKEKYEAVVEKNTTLENQMNALSNSFLSLKDDLLFLNDDGEQQHLQLMGPEHAEHLYLCAKERPEAEKQESNAGGEALDDAAAMAVLGAGDHLTDAAGDGTTSSGGGKRRSRKCSVWISKPQGAFQWTDSAPPSSPGDPGRRCSPGRTCWARW